MVPFTNLNGACACACACACGGVAQAVEGAAAGWSVPAVHRTHAAPSSSRRSSGKSGGGGGGGGGAGLPITTGGSVGAGLAPSASLARLASLASLAPLPFSASSAALASATSRWMAESPPCGRHRRGPGRCWPPWRAAERRRARRASSIAARRIAGAKEEEEGEAGGHLEKRKVRVPSHPPEEAQARGSALYSSPGAIAEVVDAQHRVPDDHGEVVGEALPDADDADQPHPELPAKGGDRLRVQQVVQLLDGRPATKLASAIE